MRFARVFVVAGLAVGAAASGCDCGGGPQPGAGIASLIARFTDGDKVQSDGQSRLKISLSALGADRRPDTKAITITAPAGALAPRDGDVVAGGSLTAEPNAQGALDFDYLCEQNADGKVALSATNGDAIANINVECTAPQGEIVITVDASACGDLQSNGIDKCVIGLEIHQVSNGVTIPFTDSVGVKVVSASADDPADTASTTVIASAQAGSSPTDTLTLAPDTAGTTSFEFRAPDVAETATVQITAGDTVVTHDVSVAQFNNRSSLTLALNRSNVTGGNQATLTITALDVDGSPAANQELGEVTIDQAGATLALAGGTASDTLNNVPLDADGKVDVTVTTAAVTTATTAIIHATYQPLIGDAIEKDAPLTVNPPGTLLLNVTADPTDLLSTGSVAERTTTLTISLTKDDVFVAGSTVDISIPAASTPLIRFASGDPVTQTISVFDTTDGTATIDVVTQDGPPVPTSVAHVVAIGHQGVNDSAQVDVPINITRGPILQNIQFISFDPEGPLGVLGSALPSTTKATFLLLDDGGNPMPGVTVSFTRNATSDPGISVQPEGTSAADGTVSTFVSAGTNPGPVTVTATAIATVDSNNNPVVRFAQSTPIGIETGLPSFETSSLSCDTSATTVPWSVKCTARLVDRFTDEIDDVVVQFNAESASQPSVQTTQQGTATATVSSSSFVNPGADMREDSSWSYAPILPERSDLIAAASGNPFTAQEAADCFDDTITTPCNIIDMCNDPQASFFCPLIPTGISDATDAALTLAAPPTALQVAQDSAGTGARQIIKDYIAAHRAGGFPVSCLVGDPDGISYINGDECPLNLGCFDFSAGTQCPQDTLRTVMASTRGAEAFSDRNGNGVFDFTDVNNNGRHDQGEPVIDDTFVDLPEPFLDANDNCVRDDYTDAVRFENTPIVAVANTDKFIDVDQNRVFGFNVGGALQRANGAWDADTQIFLTTHVLEIGPGRAIIGEACGEVGGASHLCKDGVTSTICQETTGGNIAACPLVDLAAAGAGAKQDIAFQFTDANGNCPSQNLDENANVTIEGAGVKLFGDTDVPLDSAHCGFGDVTNFLLPECRAMPNLQTPISTVTVQADCATTTGDQIETITFKLGDVVASRSFQVHCPAAAP